MAYTEVLKTVGVQRPDGNKDFDIYLMDGTVVRAVRNAGKFQVGDVVDTMKQLKILVADGLRWATSFDPMNPENAGETGETGDAAAEPAKLGAWDCIDPCALLVEDYHLKQLDSALRRTLDCYGWIDPETGEPDYDRARKEIDRFNRLTSQAVGEE